MKEIYENLCSILKECEQKQKQFRLPELENINIKDNDLKTKGSELYHKQYILDNQDESIELSIIAKDMCRTFDVKPDLNIVKIIYKKSEDIIEQNNYSWDDRI